MTDQAVLHWFDFICPFCYIAQDRNWILRDAGVEVIDLPLQIHPEIGEGGAPAPPRTGPMYEYLADEAGEAGLELNWSTRIPYSRHALATAEAVRIHEPAYHPAFIAAVFDAYFARGRDIGDRTVIVTCAEDVGLAPSSFEYSMTSGIAENELRLAQEHARERHIVATPAWLVADGQVIAGLRPRGYFVALGRALTSPDRRHGATSGL